MTNWKNINNKYIKEGARYQYPESLIRFCSTLKVVFHLGYRQEQGALQSLQKWMHIPNVISYSQMQRRMTRDWFRLS